MIGRVIVYELYQLRQGVIASEGLVQQDVGSLGVVARGDVLSLRSFWTREFGPILISLHFRIHPPLIEVGDFCW